MFYKNLPNELFKKFDGFYEKRKHSLKNHEMFFKSQEDKYFYKAQEIMLKHQNKHIKFLNKNKRFDYENNFQYIEREENILILYTYYQTMLSAILFYDLTNEEQHAYVKQQFKLTGITMMLQASTSRHMSYNDHWNVFYNHKQRLVDENTIETLKGVSKYKYIPIEKLPYINLYNIIDANKDTLHHWELLIKMNAKRLASQLVLNRRTLEKEHYRLVRSILKTNPTYNQVYNLIAPSSPKKKKTKYTIEKIIKNNNKFKINTWKFEDYIFKLPESVEEVKKEGERLNHCIYSNRNNYFKSGIAIIFMRKTNDPKEPFFTLEITNGGIKQIRTTNNQTKPEITAIANEWFNSYQSEIQRAIV